MSTNQETPRVSAGLSHAHSPSLPLTSALRRWNLRVQWTIAALSAICAIAAARWYGSYGAALGLAQFLVIFGLFGAGLIQATSTLRTQLNALCDGDLVRDVSLPGHDELAALGEQGRLLAYQLSQMVARIRSEAELIAMGGAQATATGHLAVAAYRIAGCQSGGDPRLARSLAGSRALQHRSDPASR